MAISVDYLKKNRIHHDVIGDERIVILAEPNGGSRAYSVDDHVFQSYKQGNLVDMDKQSWEVTESAILGPFGTQLKRIAGHEVFWFGWVNAFPDTRLVFRVE